MSPPTAARKTPPNPGCNRPPPLAGERRRLLYVVTHLGLGGAEVQVVDLARRMRNRGYDPHVLSILRPSALTDRLEEEGISWSTLGVRKRHPTPALVLGVARTVRRLRPHIVHSHTLPANFSARAARALCPVSVLITSCHNVDEGGRARMLYYRLTDSLADLTTNVSHAAVARYVEVGAAPPGRIQYMPNGIDTARFRPDPLRRQRVRRQLGVEPGTFLWLAVGRLEAQKDHPNMLRAFARAGSSDQVLLIVGDGPLRQELQALSANLGLEDRVRFLGLRSDIPDLMRAADGYLMSSAWEGLPIVLLESAASGLPAVVTDVGGNRQIVRPDETGFTAPPNDDAALARAMTLLLRASPERRAELGRAARALVESSLGMEAIADRWASLYRSLLDQREAPPDPATPADRVRLQTRPLLAAMKNRFG